MAPIPMAHLVPSLSHPGRFRFIAVMSILTIACNPNPRAIGHPEETLLLRDLINLRIDHIFFWQSVGTHEHDNLHFVLDDASRVPVALLGPSGKGCRTFNLMVPGRH